MFLSKYKIKNNEKVFFKNRAGRNNKGRISVRHKGGGNRRSFRTINWSKIIKNSLVTGLVYNPTHQSNLLQILNLETKTFSYTLAPIGSDALDFYNSLSQYNNRIFLNSLEIGDLFYGLASNSKNPQYIKANGCYGKILQKYTWVKNYMLILLPSGEQKLVLNNSLVNKGSLSNFSAFYEVIKKAGRNRWLRKRPTTRGVAMNPIDHPHGGGEGKTSAGRPSVSFTGRLTKNVKTSKKKRKYSWQRIKYA
jgi:large subunit ribosomal protein L2